MEPRLMSLFLGGDTSDAKITSMSLDTRKNSSLAAVTVIVEQPNRKTVLLVRWVHVFFAEICIYGSFLINGIVIASDI